MAIDGSNSTDHTSSAQSATSLSDSLAQEQASAARAREQEIRTELASNPQAVQALDKFSANLNCYNLTDAQKVQALDSFMAAPNPANAAFVEGNVMDQLGIDPAGARALKTPDAGTLTMNGQTYSIQDGALMDAQHRNAGTISNDGSVQLANEEQPRNVYSDLSARVQLQDRVAGRLTTTLDLHPADARGRLTDPNLNRDFAQRVTSTLERARREGMDMQTDLGFRTFAQQNELYSHGRTAPGNIVTNARGGQSWHNYGVAMDAVFSTPAGQPSWPENGRWSRYGEIAADNGLTWGGNWQHPDRPHVEYHPGFGTNAGGMVGTHAQSGLEGVWDRMGIGQRP